MRTRSFASDQILKITAIISRLAKYVITQVYPLREEKGTATGSDAGKRTRNLLDFNFVKKRKFDEHKNDRGSDQDKTQGLASAYSFRNSDYSKSFENPGNLDCTYFLAWCMASTSVQLTSVTFTRNKSL